jgi:hypothetical protein
MANSPRLGTARLGAASCPQEAARPRPNFKIAFPVPWSTRFENPIILPDGRVLLTLKDAADYILKCRRRESDSPEWQAAIEALMTRLIKA